MMAKAQPHHQTLPTSLDKLMHLYLPSSGNPRFANRFLITKMTMPSPMNLQFVQNESPRCLHSKNGARISGSGSKGKGKSRMEITMKDRSKLISSIDMVFSARYGKGDGGGDEGNGNQGLLSSRENVDVRLIEKNTIERWRSINTEGRLKRKQKQKQKNNGKYRGASQDIQTQVRTSISRMLQQTRDKEGFQYITRFYRKPIEREIAVRKTRTNTKNFSEILNVSQYRPHSQLKSRFHKTIQPRCRCHKNSPHHDLHRLNNTSHISKRSKAQNQQNQDQDLNIKKPATTGTGQRNRKIITLNLPENWVVDSWNTQQSKMMMGQGGMLEKCQFHD